MYFTHPFMFGYTTSIAGYVHLNPSSGSMTGVHHCTASLRAAFCWPNWCWYGLVVIISAAMTGTNETAGTGPPPLSIFQRNILLPPSRACMPACVFARMGLQDRLFCLWGLHFGTEAFPSVHGCSLAESCDYWELVQEWVWFELQDGCKAVRWSFEYQT